MDGEEVEFNKRVSISSVMAALCSPKASVKVRVLGGTPKFSNALVAKLVDAPDLGSDAERRDGSSPS